MADPLPHPCTEPEIAGPAKTAGLVQTAHPVHTLTVELPDALACYRWGTPYRPQKSLCLVLQAPEQAGFGLRKVAATSKPSADGARQAELLTPGARRVWEMIDLALEGGWLAVLHEVGGTEPALWLLVEAVADAPAAGGLAPGWRAVAWVDLASGPDQPRTSSLWLEKACEQAPLAVRPGPPASGARRRRLKLGAALEACCSAVGRLIVRQPGATAWLRRRRARLQLYLTMAALVYLRPGRPWPPPARLAVETAAEAAAPSAPADGAGTAPDPGAAAAPSEVAAEPAKAAP